MSRGLGWLQREILDTLDVAATGPGAGTDARPRGVSVEGLWVTVPDDVYDMRASCYYLATRHQQTVYDIISQKRCVRAAFQTSFSRAVKTLIVRGHLAWCDPWGRAYEPWWILLPHRRQHRFVRRPDPTAQAS
jgi:hypothetical protein